jgi:TRAP-type mannitol/chloroaromatic compound transport system substrate-binding protein
MHNVRVMTVAGLVAGVVLGATVIGPRLGLEPALGTRAPADVAGPAAAFEVVGAERLLTDPATERHAILRTASAFGRESPDGGDLVRTLEVRVWTVSAGKAELRMYEPDQLVPVGEMLDAVASGAVEAALTTPGAWAERAPALALFDGLPFGPSPAEFVAWLDSGGGRELHRAIYKRLGVLALPCGIAPPSAGGWFRKEIRTPADLVGVRMAAGGLGAKVLARAGVTVSEAQGARVFIDLESGALDAAEAISPAVDNTLGLHRMARFYYFPGWQRPAALRDLIINPKRWDALDAAQQAQIEAVCDESLHRALAGAEVAEIDALKALQKNGATVQRWNRSVLTALRTAWVDEELAIARANAEFRRVADSLKTFRTKYALWREIALP